MGAECFAKGRTTSAREMMTKELNVMQTGTWAGQYLKHTHNRGENCLGDAQLEKRGPCRR